MSEYIYPTKTQEDGGVVSVCQNLRDEPPSSTDITHHPQFRQLVRTLFDEIVQDCCSGNTTNDSLRDDLISMTRFVTWDLQERGGGALRRALPDHNTICTRLLSSKP